ncbi:MAG: Phospho-N-acetylmuramoyl-pentapeptide-transferase [Candidatus Woesebacteria bacterium GW2011_GWA2_40_7b]|uniref:Phospho-N-acetylmuramoyl-pentapeptide-transferase n=1 Tax=Candidatus Woesebacteria bacterium GW2011_GWA2_40_7b TaxID=1618563 RepID=A0A0G0VGD8_9BACT|nr:MAG: Phospho-N-acetylmuramoyl-pentapeptide-transferase [Candidatus Woesebacteria bacterium GW2011_GWA2_40_7b]
MNIRSAITLVLGILIFSFTVASLLIVPFINLLYKLKMLRRNEGKGAKKQSLFDKLHDKKAGTPTGFISFGLLGFLDDYVKIFGKAIPGKMGMWIGLGRGLKMILQVLLAFAVGFFLNQYLGINILHIPLIDKTIYLGLWYIPFAAAIIIFFNNAFNFTDGLDGLASGLLMIYLFAYIILAAGVLDTPLSMFIALWLGALMAFLYFNIWPARVFLGDAGALSFGATIAVIGLLIGNAVALFVIGGIFVIEAISSAVQIFGWKVLKRPILPLAPLHNTFLALGWEEPKIVMRAWIAGVMFAIFGLWLATI